MILTLIIDNDETFNLTQGQGQRSRSHMHLCKILAIDETLKLTQSQGHILQQSTFGSMKMFICVKQARLTYLRGVNVLVLLLALSALLTGLKMA